MYSITLLDKTTGKKFTKWIQEFPEARRYYFRCLHSKKLAICAYNFNPYQ